VSPHAVPSPGRRFIQLFRKVVQSFIIAIFDRIDLAIVVVVSGDS
jgi:hypothetical protein